MDLGCCAIFMKKVSHLYHFVEDTLMNNKKHVGSLAIGSEPINMRICLIMHFNPFLAIFLKTIRRKH